MLLLSSALRLNSLVGACAPCLNPTVGQNGVVSTVLHIALLSDDADQQFSPLPALELLSYRVSFFPLASNLKTLENLRVDLVILDGSAQLVQARNTAQLLKATGSPTPILLALTEGGLAAVAATWLVDDIILSSAGPAELEARIRLLSTAYAGQVEDEQLIRSGAILIDEASYTARLDGSPLNLTYKEFELLKFLAQHPGRVFTRAQLLAEVWGYDYYGGTRTVDVHVRRLRSKLGNEYEQLIGTVRNVGYSFNSVKEESSSDSSRTRSG